MTATAARERILRGEITARGLVEQCFSTITATEPKLSALAAWSQENVRRMADASDASGNVGPLGGIPIGVKDIIDVSGLPTVCDSSLYAGAIAARDAACVSLLKSAGGIILGKTRTTEFAYMRPSITRNPHNLNHTPGGSSSGSAAGVAAGFFPVALGTQTAGSVIRPGSYCGIYAFKPTFNTVGRAGIKPLSESFDTLGWYGRTIDDLQLVWSVFAPQAGLAQQGVPGQPRVALCRTPRWHQADEAMRALVEVTAEKLEAVEITLPPIFAQVYDDHEQIMAVDASRALRFEYTQHADQLSDVLSAFIEKGLRTDTDQERAARFRLAACRAELDRLFDDYDLFITPSAPGAAPETLASTGDSVFNRLWTAMHVPCLSIPAGEDTAGLPLGVQLVGRCHTDPIVLAHGAMVAPKFAPPLKKPAL
jgi:Asp-tRNA(Asn)/Glu-tRNA(Gln) amidotransferase A subunit family amidase